MGWAVGARVRYDKWGAKVRGGIILAPHPCIRSCFEMPSINGAFSFSGRQKQNFYCLFGSENIYHQILMINEMINHYSHTNLILSSSTLSVNPTVTDAHLPCLPTWRPCSWCSRGRKCRPRPSAACWSPGGHRSGRTAWGCRAKMSGPFRDKHRLLLYNSFRCNIKII